MNPEQNESQREFEKFLLISNAQDLNADEKINYYNVWQAACASTEKRLLASKIVGPTDQEFENRINQIVQENSQLLIDKWASGYHIEGVKALLYSMCDGVRRGCLDQIKLMPLTIEQCDMSNKHDKNDISKGCIEKNDILRHIEKLLSSDEQIEIASIKDSASFRYDNKEKYCTNKDFVEARSSAFTRGAKWLRDFISKRLAEV